MSRGMAARILRALGSSPIPCPTPMLAAIVSRPGERNARHRTWAVLRWLEGTGRVRRTVRKRFPHEPGNGVVALWSPSGGRGRARTV